MSREKPPSLGQHMPEFDSAFHQDSPKLYFYHTVDPQAGSLHVEVLGANLAVKFAHSRLPALASRSTAQKNLEKKTVGFLSLVTPPAAGNAASAGEKGPTKRVILAWAESGHGTGPTGDLLDAGGGILENTLWVRRAIHIGYLLGVKMASYCDKYRLPDHAWAPTIGANRASHVEIKLTVHAIYVLLEAFGILDTSNSEAVVTRAHLESLRQARWEDGSRPAFEVYYSRRHCGFCLGFVRRLEAATGLVLKMLWGDRLVRYEYPVRPDKRHADQPAQESPRVALPAAAAVVDLDLEMDEDYEEQMVVDLREWLPGEEIILDDEDDDDDRTVCGDDDVRELEMVDLTREPPPRHLGTIVIDHDEEQLEDVNHLYRGESMTAKHPLDDNLDGLAYCVGQIDQSPLVARRAILDFARRLIARNRARHGRRLATRSSSNGSGDANINKPLPPTPETEPPVPSSPVVQQQQPPSLPSTPAPLLPAPPSLPSPSSSPPMPMTPLYQRRSPRLYATTPGERTSPGRRTFITVQIPARRSV